jgi:RNA polymerase sigma-70 factor (ECF subfamily)
VLSEAALTNLGAAFEKVEHESEERRDALRNCLEQITGRRREVLEMRYRHNVKVGDIGKRLNMSPSGVSVMLHRVRGALYECIERQLARDRI